MRQRAALRLQLCLSELPGQALRTGTLGGPAPPSGRWGRTQNCASCSRRCARAPTQPVLQPAHMPGPGSTRSLRPTARSRVREPGRSERPPVLCRPVSFPAVTAARLQLGFLARRDLWAQRWGQTPQAPAATPPSCRSLLVGVFHRYHGNHFSNFTQRDRTHPPQETSQRQEPRQQSQSRTRVWRLLSYSAFDRNQEELHFIFSLEIGFFYQRNRAVLSLLHDRWHLC